jgi:ferredoxin
MAIKITDECINCGACEPECPNNAIKGSYVLMDGSLVTSDQRFTPVAVDTYYITPNKCTECQGFHEEPQCAAVCPVDCCVPDEMYRETVDELLAKKEKLHL